MLTGYLGIEMLTDLAGPDHVYCVISYHHETLMGVLSFLFGAIRFSVCHVGNRQLLEQMFLKYL